MMAMLYVKRPIGHMMGGRQAIRKACTAIVNAALNVGICMMLDHDVSIERSHACIPLSNAFSWVKGHPGA